jgi:RimJ/RimL family protein N-acetyltransferase
MHLMLGCKDELPMLPDSFETSRVRLRPVAVEDAEAIFSTYAQDEEVARYLIWRPHRSLSETKAYFERCMATPAEVERTYMLLGREDKLVRGAFALRTDSIAAMSSHVDGGGRA